MSDIIEEIYVFEPEFPKPFSITKWTVISSIFFLVPATYAFLNTIICAWLYWYGVLSVCTTIFSVNHWRQAEYGMRRNLDRVVAWIACIIYVSTGLLYLPGYLSIATLGAPNMLVYNWFYIWGGGHV